MADTYDPLASEGALNSFIQRARAAGKTDDEIRAFVAAKRAERQLPPPFEPRTQPTPEQAEFTGAVSDFYRKLDEDTKQAILSGAGGLVGGLAGEALGTAIPAAAATAPRIARIASGIVRAIPEAAGEFFGAGLGAQLGGMPPEEAAKTGAYSAGLGMAGRTVVRHVVTPLAGRMAKIKPETVRAGIEDPTLLRKPAPEADVEMAQRLAAETETQAGRITPAHADYQGMLANKASERVSGDDILDIFAKHVTGQDNASARVADRQVQQMAMRFIKRLGPDDTISLGELDEYIRNNFTKPLVQQYARESEAEGAKRMMAVREGLTDYLYTKVGPQAAPAQSMARNTIAKRETVENLFNTGTETNPSATGASRIRNIEADTPQAQLDRQALKAYDETYGTNHYVAAKRLSQQREWNSGDLVEAYAINASLQPTRPGFVQGVAIPVARGGARVSRVSGPLTAGAAGFVRAGSKRVKGASQ